MYAMMLALVPKRHHRGGVLLSAEDSGIFFDLDTVRLLGMRGLSSLRLPW